MMQSKVFFQGFGEIFILKLVKYVFYCKFTAHKYLQKLKLV